MWDGISDNRGDTNGCKLGLYGGLEGTKKWGGPFSGGTPTIRTTVYGGSQVYMVVSLNYCSQNGGNFYRAPYYNGNPNIGPRIIGNLDQYPYEN